MAVCFGKKKKKGSYHCHFFKKEAFHQRFILIDQ